ncbi:hypothetical protein FRB94_009090 [Tulasnella sp. JGI-2019a]|nr:hypothetical protein FRB94_009090 [Tulasnella sp. JGI-2019a]
MASDPPDDILEIFPYLNAIPELQVHPISGSSFEIRFALPRGQLGTVFVYDLGKLGQRVKDVIKYTRQEVNWLFPSTALPLPLDVDTQLLLARSTGGRVAAALPLTTDEYMGAFRGSTHGSITVRFQQDALPSLPYTTASIVVAFGHTARGAVKDVVQAARYTRFRRDSSSPLPSERHIFSNTLTYCTWNSLQPPTPATSHNALATLKGFSKDNIYPATFLIDDAWQDTENSRLLSFGSREGFLDGMKSLGDLVTKAKEDYGVTQVGVWHAIKGYWCGLDPKGFIDNYKLIKVAKPSINNPFDYIPHPSDVGRFFDDYYREIASHGCSFSKCDDTASLESFLEAYEVVSLEPEVLGAAVSVQSIPPAYYAAVIAAAAKHFGSGTATGGRVTFCMAMTPRVLLRKEIGWPSQDVQERYLLRNSNDYFPDKPDSHRYHIFTNLVNAMFTSQLNLVPDFDMFQSHPYVRPQGVKGEPKQEAALYNHPQAAFHAALRAFGSGPVTLTDVAGKTDPEVVWKLIGRGFKKTSSTAAPERSIALHASQSPFVSDDIFDAKIFQDGVGKPLRVFSRRGEDGIEGGLIGYWNLRAGGGVVDQYVAVDDVLTLVGALHGANAQRSVMYAFKAAKAEVFDLSTTPDDDILIPVRLGSFEFEIITVAPLVLSSSAPATGLVSTVEVGALGLIDKYNPLAGLSSFSFNSTSLSWEARLRCCGKLGLFVTGISSDESKHKIAITCEENAIPFEEVEMRGGVLITTAVGPPESAKDIGDTLLVQLSLSK